MEAISRF
jgi:hypothetical protein